ILIGSCALRHSPSVPTRRSSDLTIRSQALGQCRSQKLGRAAEQRDDIRRSLMRAQTLKHRLIQNRQQLIPHESRCQLLDLRLFETTQIGLVLEFQVAAILQPVTYTEPGIGRDLARPENVLAA